jgi:OOP family OmpA-OmpF porin
MPLWVLIAASAAAIVASAPPARALSCPSGPFIVFFDLDKAEVTAKARLILDNLISLTELKLKEGGCGGLGRIAISGHADRSGPERHNLRLSRLRAANVRAYLAAHGLPDDVIACLGGGPAGLYFAISMKLRDPRTRSTSSSATAPA